MSAEIELACEVCTEEFVMTEAAYTARSCIVACPCCGSTDLVVLTFDRAKTAGGRDAA